MYTMKQTLDQVKPYIPQAFLSDVALEKMGRIAGSFPANTSSYFGFEGLLHEAKAEGDYLFCIWENQGNRDVITGDNGSETIPEYFFKEKAWRDIRRFFEVWKDQEHIFYELVDRIWLEFDIDGEVPEIPVPGFLFGMNKPPEKPIENRDDYLNTEKYMSITMSALNIMAPFTVTPAFEKKIYDSFANLPISKVFQVGIMLSRPIPAVRLCIKNLNKHQLVHYLKSLDWEGDFPLLERTLDELNDKVSQYTISMDVGEKVYPRIGLECYLEPHPKGAEAWQKFMDYLVENEMCLPEKSEALLQWPGQSVEKMKHELLPTVLFRLLHHIKITIEKNGKRVAKGYTGFIHKWDNAIMRDFMRKNNSKA